MFGPFTLLDWFVVIYYILALITLAMMMLRGGENEPWQYSSRIQWGWLNIGSSLFTVSFVIEVVLLFWVAIWLNGQGAGFLAWMFIATLFLYAWSIWPSWQDHSGDCSEELYPKNIPSILRVSITLLLVFSFTIVKIYVILAAGTILFGAGAHTFALLILLAAGLIVVVGGYRALVRIQVLQNGVVAFGLLALLAWTWLSDHGLENISSLIRTQTAVFTASTSLGMGSLSWIGVLGLPVVILSFLGGEYATEHRFLLVQKREQVRNGLLFSAGLRIMLAALLLFPVLISIMDVPVRTPFWPDIQAPAQMPSGLLGLFLITIIAALVSSLSHSLSSGGLLITQEIYRPLRQRASESELTLAGRLSTTGLILFGLLLIPYFQFHELSLDVFLKIIPAYLSPPVLAYFSVLRLKHGQVSRQTWFAILPALLLGLCKIVADYIPAAAIPERAFFIWLQQMHFLEVAAYLYIVSVTIIYLADRIFSHNPSQEKVFSAVRRRNIFSSGFISEISRRQMGVTLFLLLAITSLWFFYFYPLK